jgi:ribose transport system ATP-binding protein/rhamnose transport system ATP-binding protein
MLGDRSRHDQGVAAREAAADVQAHIAEAVDAPVNGAGGQARALRFEGVSVDHRLDQVNFHAEPGEIVGMAGLAGAGHMTLIELVSGQRRPDSGKVLLPGGRSVPRGLRNAIGAGVAVVTGDRRRFGLMLDKPLWDNIGQVRAVALGRDGLVIRGRTLRKHAREHMERLRVRAPSPDERAGLLSGGNQQKVVFAKWLDAQPSVLLLDDPTRGVDVGAKAEMHTLIKSAAEAGAIVLLASTDLDELEQLCDRVLVFYRHEMTAELSGESLRVHTLLEAMNTGSVDREAA